MHIIKSATLLNEYGKPANPQGNALSNLLTMPLNGGLGDKKARPGYGFPYLFGGVATSNNQGGFFISPQKRTGQVLETLNPALPAAKPQEGLTNG